MKFREKKMIIKLLRILASAVIILTSPVALAADTGSLDISVVDLSGTPIAGVTVTALSHSAS